ncbi:multifunctional CCA addition/repair protein [Bowmanella sp. JS7-9]|uniref:Multifunctional CCA protein n=1 Tax=Pseudobowmanella zhangzhouensis TaxID=1537679 RepID=A0ABW1XK07_9ALTE|nr:multifunctional CCA addition/repair protein [Bowmanella sp. JS7-9]TBX25753.1 2', 3'-cyclic nucleotide 2'-phosphodiesterase [Bowmanella sp. JS7-9]
MQIYLVGGAVRDKLLHLPVKDKDWVVVGASSEQMLEQGFIQVGKDFPVFLHPQSNEEYALARTERKTGTGYTGFSCDTSKDVTLELDLLRRDLTINAMAEDETGKIIDPYGGLRDLQDKILRHVSPAFSEDPLRVLRVARFAARFHHLGFRIAGETINLMSDIAQHGELNTLSPERVWQETARALGEHDPHIYFDVLHRCDALEYWFMELDRLWGVPNPAMWHPEIDTGVHTLMVLEQACQLSDKLSVRFAALVHDVGKGLTPAQRWPSHRGHETLGLQAIRDLCERIRAPNECRDLALLVSEYHSHVHRAFELRPATLLNLFDSADAWRKPQRFDDFLTACRADARGRSGFESTPYLQADYVRQAFNIASAVEVKSIIDAGYQGKQIREQLDIARIAALNDFKHSWQQTHH